MPYVVSTLSNSQVYTSYVKPEGDEGKNDTRPATPKHQVLIEGGAHVQNALRTPEGVLTKVSDEDVDFLKECPAFLDHQAGGYVRIIKMQADPDRVARDLTKRDDSAQLSEAHGDFEEGGRAFIGDGDQPKII